MPTSTDNATIEFLRSGKLSLRGEFMWGSNYTYLVQVDQGTQSLQAVYKPTRGVRPLWDFSPASLARREVAAYLVSEALGWSLVPPTVYRRDGPLGPGSLQLFIEHNPEYHYFNFSAADRQRLRPLVAFDLIANNADRKGSHVLVAPDQHLWLIDHGICFHVEDKLRTVVWDFAGEPLPDKLCADLARLQASLSADPSSETAQALQPYINNAEIAAMSKRIERLLAAGCFPNPDSSRRQYPWPPV